MKFKIQYIYVAYEIGSFIYEMYKRKASSIKFQFQDSGKFNVYIDDVSFKTIDAKIGWQIVKTLYTTATKKAEETFNKDTSFISESDFSTDELKDAYVLSLFPLTKGRCLTYSYCKKEGGIYEAVVGVKKNDLGTVIKEKIDKLSESVSDKNFSVFISRGGEKFEIDNIFIKNDKIKVYLENDIVISEDLSLFKNKKDFDKFIQKVAVEDITITDKNKDLNW